MSGERNKSLDFLKNQRGFTKDDVTVLNNVGSLLNYFIGSIPDNFYPDSKLGSRYEAFYKTNGDPCKTAFLLDKATRSETRWIFADIIEKNDTTGNYSFIAMQYTPEKELQEKLMIPLEKYDKTGNYAALSIPHASTQDIANRLAITVLKGGNPHYARTAMLHVQDEFLKDELRFVADESYKNQIEFTIKTLHRI